MSDQNLFYRFFRAKLGKIDSLIWVYIIAGALYLFSVWEHVPYGGGHIYSDISTVFQNRFCTDGSCSISLPYLHTFVEYPVVTGFFIYAMGLLGSFAPLYPSHDLLSNYYSWTAIFLAVPTFLSIGEIFRIGRILGVHSIRRRILLYFVATPTFVFMVLTNWYIIGVFFALLGLRKFLEGSRWISGALFGISAATNLVTAMPALGMIFAIKEKREAAIFMGAAVATVGAIYLPFFVLNPSFVSQFLTYEAGWYVEGNWMLLIMNSYNPMRHIIFPASFLILSFLIGVRGLHLRKRIALGASSQEWANYTVLMASLFAFNWLFSSYISTPQTNVMLVPFFALLPMSKYYGEFFAFDLANSLIIVWGFSQPFLVLGITLSHVMFGSPYHSPVQALEVVRSLWIGKFLIFDGLFSHRFSNFKL